MYGVHLTNEDTGCCEEEGSTIHVYITPDGQHEPGDARIDAKRAFHRFKGHRQCCSPEKDKEK